MYIGKYGCFRKWWYPQIIPFNRVFHYKPSILGYPYFWKHPYTIPWSTWDTSHDAPTVEVVTLTGNPLKALRQALVAKGWSAVAQHLRKQRLEVQGLSRKNWRAGDSGMRDDGDSGWWGCLQQKGWETFSKRSADGLAFGHIGRTPPKLRCRLCIWCFGVTSNEDR